MEELEKEVEEEEEVEEEDEEVGGKDATDDGAREDFTCAVDENDAFARFTGGPSSLVESGLTAVACVDGVRFFLALLDISWSNSFRCCFDLDTPSSGEDGCTICIGIFLRLRLSNICGFTKASKWCPAVW